MYNDTLRLLVICYTVFIMIPQPLYSHQQPVLFNASWKSSVNERVFAIDYMPPLDLKSYIQMSYNLFMYYTPKFVPPPF